MLPSQLWMTEAVAATNTKIRSHRMNALLLCKRNTSEDGPITCDSTEIKQNRNQKFEKNMQTEKAMENLREMNKPE